MRPLVVMMLMALLLTFTLAADRTKRDVDDEDEDEDESDENDDDDRRRTTTTTMSTTTWSYVGMPCTNGYQCGKSMCCVQPSEGEPATCQKRKSWFQVCDITVPQDKRKIIPEVVQYCTCHYLLFCQPSTITTPGYCNFDITLFSME